jgi:uncharacterized protein (DUF58 family)
MTNWEKFERWLEGNWVRPAYGGCVLAGIALCLFGAATNTMAGWLYVISGMMFALLGLGAILPVRALKELNLRRSPIDPVPAGDCLTIELEIENPSKQPKTLLQVKDLLPFLLSPPMESVIEVIPPQSSYPWVYYAKTNRRGVYRWHDVELRTGTPLGLFWCCRGREVNARAVVYPPVLPLSQCPLIDSLGKEESLKLQSERLYKTATEGVTRALRHYRRGDPSRLIHWRTSARLGELQVRELEIITGGQEVIICLDSASVWEENSFEDAVIAAASLYFYASKCLMDVKLWTAGTGLNQGNTMVLETLAAVQSNEETTFPQLPNIPLIWLTQNGLDLRELPLGSRWILFSSNSKDTAPPVDSYSRGLVINKNEPLQTQLQQHL